jgi:hypothetical protein
MEGKRTSLWEGIPNKTWKGNSPIIRGYPPIKEVAVIHCWGYQRDLPLVTQGNNWADQKAKQAAL